LAYLFDTDAVSEVLRKQPLPAYLEWLASIPPDKQFTSAVVVGELYRGAFRSSHQDRHLTNIEGRILSALTVLPYDHFVACVYGKIHATLTTNGQILEDADLQIAATAIYHGLELVTGNVQHFERIQNLRLQHVLADAKRTAAKEQAQRSATS
jgi:predicted nucleic acid-binding protein